MCFVHLPTTAQVERTLQRFKSELEQFQALLKRHDNVYSAAIVAEPSLRRDASSNITECHIVLRVRGSLSRRRTLHPLGWG